MIGITYLLTFLFFGTSFNAPLENETDFFWKHYQTESVQNLDACLSKFSGSSRKHKVYYAAAMTKKAGLVSSVSEKMNLFKKGRDLLEEEIKKDPKTMEWRFIRFTIQDNIPSFLGYSSNLEEDKKVVYNEFSKASPVLKKYILMYAKDSESLDQTKLKN